MSPAIRVLIVDDMVNVRTTIKNVLHGFDCIYFDAANGVAALALFKELRFDVVFLDIRLPDISGLETLRRARQLQPNLGKVIMLTGYPEAQTRAEAATLGAFAYFSKAPISRIEIRDAFIRASSLTSETD